MSWKWKFFWRQWPCSWAILLSVHLYKEQAVSKGIAEFLIFSMVGPSGRNKSFKNILMLVSFFSFCLFLFSLGILEIYVWACVFSVFGRESWNFEGYSDLATRKGRNLSLLWKCNKIYKPHCLCSFLLRCINLIRNY